MGKNNILVVCVSMVCAMLFFGTAGADDDDIRVSVDVALRQSTLEENLLEASVILVGRVEAIGDLTHPEVVGMDRASFSLEMEVILSVSRWIKGESPEEIALITAQQDTTIAVYSPPAPRFAVGEELLLLASPWKGGYYVQQGWYTGKYTILGNKIAGSDVRVEEFIQQIQELLAGERSRITVNVPRHVWPSTSVEETTWGQIKSNFK